MMFKKYFVLIFLISLSSCSKTGLGKKLPDIAPAEFKEMLASADPDFRKGWQDGCEVGTSAGANTFYKMFYKSNKVDGYKMADSSAYKTAWSYSFWYCYRHTHIKHQSSIWGAYFSGYR